MTDFDAGILIFFGLVGIAQLAIGIGMWLEERGKDHEQQNESEY